MSPRIVVGLADTHCGSVYGLIPRQFETFYGSKYEPNPLQLWLLNCWEDCHKWIRNVVGSDAYAVVIDGDLTEFVHHHTIEIVSPNEHDHADIAIETLAPVTKDAAAIFVVEGTECHSKNAEHDIARKLGAIRNPDSPAKQHAWERLDLTVAGCRCIFQHHISTTSRGWLDASGLGIHLAQEQLESVRNGEKMPTMLCCAHRHNYTEVRNHKGVCVTLPPWQMLTRHGRKVVPSSRTHSGAVIFDWRNRNDGDKPETHAMTYNTPQGAGWVL